MYGNFLVTAASQGRKRFQSEPFSAAEGLHVIDKETLRAVESQKCGTVIESDRNYTFCSQLEDVKIGSAPRVIQLQDVKTCSATQVTEKEASVCAVTVEREQHQCSVLIAPEAEVFFKIDSKLMWRLPGVAKYLGQLLPGFCQVSTLPRNWGYSIVKYEKKLSATAVWSKS